MGVPDALLARGNDHIWSAVLSSIDASLWSIAYPDLLVLVDPNLPIPDEDHSGSDPGVNLNVPLVASMLCYMGHPEAKLWYAWCPDAVRDQITGQPPTAIIQRAMLFRRRLWKWRLPPQIKTHPKWFTKASSLGAAVANASLGLQLPGTAVGDKGWVS